MKEILLSNSVHTRPRQENSKKIEKPLSNIIFSQYGDEIGRERGKKILLPNSDHTRPRQENSKKISKKLKKLKNLFPILFLAKTGMR